MRRAVVVLAVIASLCVPVTDAFAATTQGTFHAVSPTRLASAAVAAHHTMSVAVAGHAPLPASGIAAVAVQISAVSPTSAGGLIASASARSSSTPTTVRFVAKQSTTNSAILAVSSTGKISIYNNSAGSVTVLVDASGYYASGSTAMAGSFHPVAPTRVVGPTTVKGGRSIVATIAGHPPVPSNNVGAVALNVTVTSATHAGALLVYANDDASPGDAVTRFATGQVAATFAIVRVSPNGRIVVANTASSGSVSVTVDVEGYFTAGGPTLSGTTVTLPYGRVAKVTIGAGATLTLPVGGAGGVARAAVAAAVLTFTVATPTAAGSLVAYRSGVSRPSTTNLRFATGRPSVASSLVALAATGKIAIFNNSSRPTAVIVDVSAYVRSATIPVPTASVGRYIRTVGTALDMHNEGCTDKASRLVVLDIGAQTTDKLGVKLSATTTVLTYGQLVTALESYVGGYASCGGTGTIAVVTNNDATDSAGTDWTSYSASQRGADWASKVIVPLINDASAKHEVVSIAGADDIEATFFSTEAQAQAWENAFLLGTSANLYFVGSADGCPTTFGSTANCAYGWTLADMYALSHGTAATRPLLALPQIYLYQQAVQWANITRGRSTAGFAGALTEFGACPAIGPGCTLASLAPADGWADLRNALASLVATPSLPGPVDLEIS